MTIHPCNFISIFFLLIICPKVMGSEQAVILLREEIQRAARQRDEARKEFLEIQTEAESQIRSLSEAQLELSRQLERADKSLLELEAESRQSAAAVQRAEEEILRKDGALRELEAQLAENRARLEEIQSRPASRESRDAEAEVLEQLARQQEELTQLEEARSQAEADRSALEQLNRELRESLAATQRAESLSNAKLAALEARLDNLNLELERLYQERSDLEQEQERLHGVIADLQTRLTDAEENRVPRAELQALQNQLTAAEEENRMLRSELEERRAVPDLREAYAAAKRDRDLLQAKQKTLSSKVSSLEESLQEERRGRVDERERRRGLEVELSREQRQRRELEKEIRRLQSGLEAATAAGIEKEEIAEVSMLVAELEEENRMLKQESLQYREEADRLMSELTDAQSSQSVQIRELQTVLGEQMIQLTDAQRKIDALEAKTITLDSVRLERDNLISVRDRSRRDMKVLARHIYELREELVERRNLENQLKNSGMDRQRLQQEIEKQQRLTRALREEQERKDRQILELRKRLATENPSVSEGAPSP